MINIFFFFISSVVFGILQARDRGRLCWKSKPNYVPDWSKGHYDGVTPSYAMQDSDNEGEFSPTAKARNLFPQTVIFKYPHRPGTAQNVWQVMQRELNSREFWRTNEWADIHKILLDIKVLNLAYLLWSSQTLFFFIFFLVILSWHCTLFFVSLK